MELAKQGKLATSKGESCSHQSMLCRARGTVSHHQSQAQTTPASQPPVHLWQLPAHSRENDFLHPLCPWHTTVNTEQPWADRWAKSMQGILISSLEFRILSSLLVQELTGLSMVSYDPVQFHTATSAARHWTVQVSASLRQRSSCFYLLLRSSLDQLRTLHSSWRNLATWHWSLVIATLTQVKGKPNYVTYSWIICILHRGWIL